MEGGGWRVDWKGWSGWRDDGRVMWMDDGWWRVEDGVGGVEDWAEAG